MKQDPCRAKRLRTRSSKTSGARPGIALEGLRGEENISALCRREGIAASMYYGWSKEFLEAGKRRHSVIAAALGSMSCSASNGEQAAVEHEASA